MKYVIPADVLNIKEPVPVPSGYYTLIIVSAEDEETKNGDPAVAIQLSIEGHDNADDIFFWLNIPTEDSKQFVARIFGRFCANFEIDMQDFDSETLVGMSAECPVSIENTEEYGKQNRYEPPLIPE